MLFFFSKNRENFFCFFPKGHDHHSKDGHPMNGPRDLSLPSNGKEGKGKWGKGHKDSRDVSAPGGRHKGGPEGYGPPPRGGKYNENNEYHTVSGGPSGGGGKGDLNMSNNYPPRDPRSEARDQPHSGPRDKNNRGPEYPRDGPNNNTNNKSSSSGPQSQSGPNLNDRNSSKDNIQIVGSGKGHPHNHNHGSSSGNPL